MEYITLNNDVKMPILGYGTYQTPPRITEKCVTDAINLGYRSIDTAQCYGNEKEVGLACRKSGIARKELFITTKLWACHGYQDTLRSIDGSLKKLNMDYIDLLLIHEPTGDVHEIYRAMETAYSEGKLRAIGISNFLEERYLDLVNHCKVIPAINQVEMHVFRQQKKLRQLECQIGTKHESWSPLACGRNGIWRNPALVEIANNHSKSVSQIALRFLLQQGIIIIPKSTNMEHMKENITVFDFDLEADEMREIEQLEIGKSLFDWW
ncbi:MAG: aldo/keto reductase [Clostridium sp.]|nr:aldo/keto reductase [Clostridium sp.]MCM1459622.1 aldo/keto reductase [Bacteroides sp.]